MNNNSFDSNAFESNSIGFEEPHDMTKPEYGTYDYRNTVYDNQPPKNNASKQSVVESGILVNIYMLVMMAYMAYMALDINFVAKISTFKALSSILTVVFFIILIVDAVKVSERYGHSSIIALAILLPILYPLRRASVMGRKKAISALWLILMIGIGVLFFKNLVPTAMRYSAIQKSSSDIYASQFDEPAAYLKGRFVEDGKEVSRGRLTIDYAMKRSMADVKWNAKRLDDGSYCITATGKTKSRTAYTPVNANGNTIFTFNVNRSKTKWKITDLYMNGSKFTENAQQIFAILTKKAK